MAVQELVYNEYMRRGFTLIELMVVVTIGLLLVGGISVSTGRFLARERVASSANELVSVINIARNFAVTNQVPVGFTGLDYVAVTLTSSGLVSVFPVNNTTGIGSSYLSKQAGNLGINFTPINFGGLLFGAGSGKLVGKNADPSYVSYPLPSASNVGVTVSSDENSITRQIIISPFGSVSSTNL